jgi:hypothetical protein
MALIFFVGYDALFACSGEPLPSGLFPFFVRACIFWLTSFPTLLLLMYNTFLHFDKKKKRERESFLTKKKNKKEKLGLSLGFLIKGKHIVLVL